MSTSNIFRCIFLVLHFSCFDAYDQYGYEYDYEVGDEAQFSDEVFVLEEHPAEEIRVETRAAQSAKDSEIPHEVNNERVREDLTPAYLSANLACGLSYSNEQRALEISPKIVGGHQAHAGDYPWQVSLVRYGQNWGSGGSHACAGSIISSQWILSAAHCFYGYNGKTSVAVGSTNRKSSQMKKYEVNKVLMHPKYQQNGYRHDIALIKLQSPIQFTSTNGAGDKASVGPVCLPHENDYYAGMASVSGWGAVADDRQAAASQVLMALEVNILEQEDCKKYKHFNDDLQLCAGWTEGGKDSCYGDSGGPLVTRFGNEAVQIGIVSYGIGCARNGYPGVYTKVSAYRGWIRTNSGV